MAYNESTLNHIQEWLHSKNIPFQEKRMFSGVCIMVDDKMCCGTHIDKASDEDYLLCRIGEQVYEDALEKEHVLPMTFTGKPMKGYVFVTSEGFKTKETLGYWMQHCLDFNPKAKKSKK